MIGAGTFGKVYLGIIDGKAFAIKVLKKNHILETNQSDHIKAEKNILTELSHPFIVNM